MQKQCDGVNLFVMKCIRISTSLPWEVMFNYRTHCPVNTCNNMHLMKKTCYLFTCFKS